MTKIREPTILVDSRVVFFDAEWRLERVRDQNRGECDTIERCQHENPTPVM